MKGILKKYLKILMIIQRKNKCLCKLIIYLINKNIKLPDELIDKNCSSINCKKIIEFIPSFLSNENISDN